MQAQLTQEVKRADALGAELMRQQDDAARKGIKVRATGDMLGSRTPGGGLGTEELIPASRSSSGVPTGNSELELLRKKLKVGFLLKLAGCDVELVPDNVGLCAECDIQLQQWLQWL